VTDAHACEQLAQGCYLEADWSKFEPVTWPGRERTLYRYTTQDVVLYTNTNYVLIFYLLNYSLTNACACVAFVVGLHSRLLLQTVLA